MPRPLTTQSGMNQALRTPLATAFALLALAGCSRASAPSQENYVAAAEEAALAPAPAATTAITPTPREGAADGVVLAATSRSLIVKMQMALVVADVDLALGTIRGAAERSGGYVGEATASGTGNTRRAHVVLRVPSTQARDLRGSIAALGRVESDNESAVDVTEQHADLEARLANARVQEKRILEIMKNGAGSIADVLYAEGELAKVRGSIESMQAQKTTLDRQIAMATLQIDLSLPAPTPIAVVPPATAVDTPLASIGASAKRGMHGAYAVLVYGLMALAAALPFLLPIAACCYAIFWFVRRRSQRVVALRG